MQWIAAFANPSDAAIFSNKMDFDPSEVSVRFILGVRDEEKTTYVGAKGSFVEDRSVAVEFLAKFDL